MDPNLHHGPFFHWVGFQAIFPWQKIPRSTRSAVPEDLEPMQGRILRRANGIPRG